MNESNINNKESPTVPVLSWNVPIPYHLWIYWIQSTNNDTLVYCWKATIARNFNQRFLSINIYDFGFPKRLKKLVEYTRILVILVWPIKFTGNFKLHVAHGVLVLQVSRFPRLVGSEGCVPTIFLSLCISHRARRIRFMSESLVHATLF